MREDLTYLIRQILPVAAVVRVRARAGGGVVLAVDGVAARGAVSRCPEGDVGGWAACGARTHGIW